MAINKQFVKSLASEFLVTLLWAFTVFGLSINFFKLGADGGTTTIAAGLVGALSAIALIYSFMHSTIAHFNPAITLGAMVTMKLNGFKGLAYIVVQVVGAIAGVAILRLCFDDVPDLPIGRKSNTPIIKAIIMELLLTFFLVYVAFAAAINAPDNPTLIEVQVADEEKKEDVEAPGENTVLVKTKMGSSTAGFGPLAIGVILGGLGMIGTTSSGAVYNPALAFAGIIFSGDWGQIYIYLVGEFVGGCLAALLHVFVLGPERKKSA